MCTSFVKTIIDQPAFRTIHLNVMRLQKDVSGVGVKDDGARCVYFCIPLQPPVAYVNHPKAVLPRRRYHVVIINDTAMMRSG